MKVQALQISIPDFLERIRRNLFIINNIPLHIGDNIILKEEIKNCLSNTKNDKEKLLINRIIYTLADNINEFEIIFTPTDKEKIRRFLLMIISKVKLLK